MAGKDHVLKYSQTAASNTDIAGINTDEGNDPSTVNNAIRQEMKQASDGFITRVVDKATGATAGLTDHNQLWRCTADLTITLTAAATLTSGWELHILADGGTVTVDGDSSELIDGSLTITVNKGQYITLYCTGAAFYTSRGYKNAWEEISRAAYSGAASAPFIGLSAYRQIRARGYLTPATDNVNLNLQVSVDNGANYLAGASEYQRISVFSTGAALSTGTAAATAVVLDSSTGIGNASGEFISFNLEMYNFNQGTILTGFTNSLFRTNAGAIRRAFVDFDTVGTTARDAFRLIMSSGNLSGHIVVEGVRG
jgi:hypothetical protein